jgi:hypothetical protein
MSRFILIAVLSSLSMISITSIAAADDKKPARGANTANTAPAPKVKTYNFSSLDIEGKLKTPQLLYFLNRMQSEFDATTPARRSFLPELKRSTDGM